MTEDQALQIGRKAVGDAIKRVGDQRDVLERELEKMIEEDPKLITAFALAGHLILRSGQEVKH